MSATILNYANVAYDSMTIDLQDGVGNTGHRE